MKFSLICDETKRDVRDVGVFVNRLNSRLHNLTFLSIINQIQLRTLKKTDLIHVNEMPFAELWCSYVYDSAGCRFSKGYSTWQLNGKNVIALRIVNLSAKPDKRRLLCVIRYSQTLNTSKISSLTQRLEYFFTRSLPLCRFLFKVTWNVSASCTTNGESSRINSTWRRKLIEQLVSLTMSNAVSRFSDLPRRTQLLIQV